MNETSSVSLEHAPIKGAWGPFIVLVLALGFLLLKYLMAGLHHIHLLFVVALLSCYFVHPLTRKFLVIALPIAGYAIVYDLFRYIPFEALQPIHVGDLYHLDLSFFGVWWAGKLMPLHHWAYQIASHPLTDLITGTLYFLHVPVVLLTLFMMWRFKGSEVAQRFTMAFLLINLTAFATYYLYSAAAPWYVDRFGFEIPTGWIAGDAAGLVRFDQILGIDLFTTNYQISPIPFGAMPSMHAGYATLCWLYYSKFGRGAFAFFSIYVVAMYFSALYLQHHYLLDLMVGSIFALICFLIVEKILRSSFDRVNQKLMKFFGGEGWTVVNRKSKA